MKDTIETKQNVT